MYRYCSLTSCSQVLQSVDLEISTEDNSQQQMFRVIEKTLTVKEAQKQKSAPYNRSLLKNGEVMTPSLFRKQYFGF